MGLPCGLPQISQSYLRGLPFEKVGDPSNSYKRWSDIESNTTPTTKASFVGQSLGFTRLWPSKRDITNIYESLPRSNHFSLIQTPVSSPFTFSDVLPPSFPSSHPNVWIVYSMSSSDNKSQKNVAANLLIVDSSPDATIFQCKWRIFFLDMCRQGFLFFLSYLFYCCAIWITPDYIGTIDWFRFHAARPISNYRPALMNSSAELKREGSWC